MKNKLTYLFTACIFLASCQKPLDLSLKLQKDTEYSLSCIQRSSVYQEIEGKSINYNIQMDDDFRMNYSKLSGADYNLKTQYKKTYYKLVSDELRIVGFSDKDDSTNIMSQLLKGITGKEFTICITKNGKVRGVKGLDALYKNTFDFLDTTKNNTNLLQLISSVKDTYNQDNLIESIEQATHIFPNINVQKNKEWIIEKQIQTGRCLMKSTYKVVDVTSDIITIEGSSVIRTPIEEDYALYNDAYGTSEMQGTATSKIKLDRKTCWVNHATINQKLEGVIFLKDQTSGEVSQMKIKMVDDFDFYGCVETK